MKNRKLRYIPWTSESAQPILQKRIEDAIQYREKSQEPTWKLNEQTIFAPEGVSTQDNEYRDSTKGLRDYDQSPNEAEGFDAFGMNYAVRFYRLIQAQLSANPPSVTPTPLTSDQKDIRRAKAANDIIKYALRQYDMQEEFDLLSGQVVCYGTGVISTKWNELGGDPIKFDPETYEILEMEGDMCVNTEDMWDIYLDPLAKKQKDLRFVIKKNRYTEQELRAYWPHKADEIMNFAEENSGKAFTDSFAERNRNSTEIKEKQYTIYEYWEKGLPENAFQGRYVEAMLEDGTCLTPPEANPHRFAPSKNSLPVAQLPFHIITDIDVSNQVYGETFITFLTKIQDTMNKLDLQVLENIRAHGATQMILPQGAKLAGDAPTNSSFDVIEYEGGNGTVQFAPTPGSMPDIAKLRADIMQGMQDIAGTNESMFGQQSRETSGFSMQYATNQGNLIRRRLFNKYVKVTEGVYGDILELVKKYWSEGRQIKVSGEEGAFDMKTYSSSDIDGGYDLVVQYGTSFSLDPMTRRQEILQLIPLYKEAGRPMDELIKHIKLNDADTMDDLGQNSGKRMREDLDTMIISGDVISPKEWQNHEGRMKFLIPYLESAEFDRLPLETKNVILAHKKQREEMMASQMSGGGSVQGGAPAETPQAAPVAEGAPPMDASQAPMNPAPM